MMFGKFLEALLMYALIESGGKQYQVKEGDEIEVDLIHSDEKLLKFEKVLVLNDGTKIHVGAPYVANCIVTGELVGECKGPKVIAFKYKKCKNYRRKVGHRQKYSRVKITKIGA